MQNRDNEIKTLLQSLEDLATSAEKQKLPDREVIIKNFLQLFKYMPQVIEAGVLQYESIAQIIRTYCWTVETIKKLSYKTENDYINHPEWIRTREFAYNAVLLIKNSNREKKNDENKELDSEDNAIQENLFRMFLLNLQMLALPYAEQKPFYPPIANILEEVVWDFEFYFSTLPQLIERNYFNYDAIAWSIRTYLELEKCVDSVGYDDEDIYENSLEWNEVRRVANHTLTFMQPLKYELKDVTDW